MTSTKPIVIILLFLHCVYSLFGCYTAFADEIEEENRKLEQVRQKIQQVTDQLQDRQAERSQQQQQLATLEKSISQKRRAIRRLNKQINGAQHNLKQLRQEQQQLTIALAGQRQRLAAQIRSAYIGGGQEHMKLLLNQQDPSALARVLKYYEYLNQARLDTITAAQTTLAELEQVAVSINQETSQLNTLKQQQESEKSQLDQQRTKRQAVLATINADIATQKEQIDTLKADELRIQELITSLSGIFADIPLAIASSDNFPQLKGKLPWPVIGKALNKFGEQRASGDLIWNGVRLQARQGSDVKAISHGRVAFSDWLPGLGLIIIIDHSQGYMSLYGYNEALFKETGDWVDLGEVIASVGDGGSDNQPSLYFELRYQGKPIDPKHWCTSG